MSFSKVLKAIAVSLLFFQLILDAGIFFGMKFAQSLSILLLPLTNFSVYFGLSLLLYPIYGRNYSSFWHMAIRRGCIPVLLSSLLYLPLIFILFSITALFFQRLNEPQLISLTLFTAFLHHVLAVLRVVLEVRVETPDFQPNPVNVFVLISLLLSCHPHAADLHVQLWAFLGCAGRVEGSGIRCEALLSLNPSGSALHPIPVSALPP